MNHYCVIIEGRIIGPMSEIEATTLVNDNNSQGFLLIEMKKMISLKEFREKMLILLSENEIKKFINYLDHKIKTKEQLIDCFNSASISNITVQTELEATRIVLSNFKKEMKNDSDKHGT